MAAEIFTYKPKSVPVFTFFSLFFFKWLTYKKFMRKKINVIQISFEGVFKKNFDPLIGPFPLGAVQTGFVDKKDVFLE